MSIKMKYVNSILREQMQLLVSNQLAIIYLRQIIKLMFYQIALLVMIKGKLTKCCIIIKVRVVIINLNDLLGSINKL